MKLNVFKNKKHNPKYLFVLILILLFCLSDYGYADDKFKVLYTSPFPGSDENTLQTNLIIRTNKVIDGVSVSANFKVIGSRSGHHEGNLKLSDDGRTIIFNPYQRFSTNETIYVESIKSLKSIQGELLDKISFSFRTILRSGNGNIQSEYLEKSGLLTKDSFNTISKTEVNTITADSLPADFPHVNITLSDNPHSDYLFIGTTAKIPYLMILDNNGKPLYYKKTPSGTYDFKVQPNGTLTYFDMKSQCFIVMDSSYKVIDSIIAGNGYYTDLHELRILPNGHSLIISFIDRVMDLSRIVEGGSTEAIVVGSVIQELDKDKNVVFQWRCQDYFDVKDTYTDLRQNYIDYTHANAIDLDDDGNFLVSFRNMQEITKIDRETGKIIWRLGGKKNQFTFINDTLGFSWQHAIRRLENGNFLLFDNGFKREKNNYSRAIEYKLDEKLKIAELVWQYRNNPDIYSYGLGYAQRLNNGNTLIGWGTEVPSVTEVRADGTKAFEMSLPNNLTTYRAYRFPWKNKISAEKKLLFSPLDYNFGSIAIGDTVLVLIEVKNNSDESVAINSLRNSTRVFYTPLNFPVTIPANGKSLVKFYFKPVSFGSVEDTFVINYDNGNEKIVLTGNGIVSAVDESDNIPESVALYQNYPNPFNLSTTIRYQLPEAGDVKLIIYNLLGELVAELIEGHQEPGSYEIKWNGYNSEGLEINSGVYIYSIRAGKYSQSYKMLLLK